MTVVFVLLIFALIGAIWKLALMAADGEKQRRQRFFEQWRELARSGGLGVEQFTATESRAKGMIGGASVHANLKLEHIDEQAFFRSVLSSKGENIPRNLSVHRDSAMRSVGRWIEGDDVPIGDPGFDSLVELSAVDARICAALGHKARTHLSRLLEWGGHVEDGKVVCKWNWEATHARAFPALIRSTAALGRLLDVPPAELPERLATNAVQDPAPDVRLRNLQYLVLPETKAPPALLAATVGALLDDADPPVRRLAALHAGVQGHAVLRALAANTQHALAGRIEAVQGLGRPPVADSEGLCAVLLDPNHPPELVCAALSVIGASAGAALVEAVSSCTSSPHETVRAAASSALGALARPETEPILLRLLSDGASEVQRASAEALGAFGSVAAVAPLLPLADSLLSPRLRQAARGAIGRIQSRLGDVEAGRLTLSDPDPLEGAVHVVEASALERAGALSLTVGDVAAGSVRARVAPPDAEALDGARPGSDASARSLPARRDRNEQ